MKSIKKLIAIVLLLAVIVNLCSCTSSSRYTDLVKAQSNLLLALEYLMDSNNLVSEALNAEFISDVNSAIDYYRKSDIKLQKCQNKLETALGSSNYFPTAVTKLREYYDKTVYLLKNADLTYDSDAITDYETYMYIETVLHLYLSDLLQCFINLYSIRIYEEIPDNDSRKSLDSAWFTFGFHEEIECPDSIETEELYIIWAEQFAQDNQLIHTNEFNEALEACRYNDKLGNDCDDQWLALILDFIITDIEKEATNVASDFFILLRYLL